MRSPLAPMRFRFSAMHKRTGLCLTLLNDQIWDTQAWDCVLDIAVDSPILCCAFERVGFQSKAAFSSTDSVENSVESPAHLPLATGCEDGSVRIFDMRCGVAQQTLLGHNGGLHAFLWLLTELFDLVHRKTRYTNLCSNLECVFCIDTLCRLIRRAHIFK